MHDLIMLVVTIHPLAGICPYQSSIGCIAINSLLTFSGPKADCTGTSQWLGYVNIGQKWISFCHVLVCCVL
jgi:hypothetical protein